LCTYLPWFGSQSIFVYGSLLRDSGFMLCWNAASRTSAEPDRGGVEVTEPVPVIWLSLHEGIDARGPWDTAILERLFNGDEWGHGIEFEHCRRRVLHAEGDQRTLCRRAPGPPSLLG
jgi:hypothetical protein